MVTFGYDGDGRRLCALNITDDCLGLISITESYVDEEGQAWNVCPNCVAHEKAQMEKRGLV